LTYLREAETLATALEDTRRLGQITVALSNHFYWMGMYDDAIAAGQRTLTLARANRDVVQRALANLQLGIAYWIQGDARRASACLHQSVTALEGPWRYERFGQVLVPAVHARGMLLWCCADLGTFLEGRGFGAEGLQMAERVAHVGSLMYAYAGVGWLALCQGDLQRALPYLEHAMRLCHEADLPAYFPRQAAILGAAYTLAGRLGDAIPLLTQRWHRGWQWHKRTSKRPVVSR
jgi:tetratricopeptide (TPR) repeat protein